MFDDGGRQEHAGEDQGGVHCRQRVSPEAFILQKQSFSFSFLFFFFVSFNLLLTLTATKPKSQICTKTN
jgi:hypothetical protein